MKALTLHQPWASLIAGGIKKEETRGWYCSFRGPLAIHAGKYVDLEACDFFHLRPELIARGVVLCTVEMVDCVESAFYPNKNEYGNFEAGRFVFVFENLKVLTPAVPAKGNRLLWEWIL
jgi:hypothetical protein